MKKDRGSVNAIYTIEAAVLIPLVLFVMAASISLGISLYTEVATEASEYQDIQKLDEVKRVHEIRTLGTVWEEISEE